MVCIRLAIALLLSVVGFSFSANPRPYPPVDAYLRATDVLDHESYLEGLDDHVWYLDNIPFIDVPDKQMQDVYYYRTSVIKRHLKWAHEGHGKAKVKSMDSRRRDADYHPERLRRDGIHTSGCMGIEVPDNPRLSSTSRSRATLAPKS